MFTINISISAENLQTSVSNFIEHMKPPWACGAQL